MGEDDKKIEDKINQESAGTTHELSHEELEALEKKKAEEAKEELKRKRMTTKYEWPAVPNRKVVVGMTGGIDSTVAAFLLKKQGYDCIGISIIFINEEEMRSVIKIPENEDGYFARKSHQQKITQEERTAFLNDHCSVKNVEAVGKICEKLGIPFFVVNAVSEYKHFITDRMVGASLCGEQFPTCLYENNLKLSILNEKAKKLGASLVSTGHYAKILRHQGSDLVDICVSNDFENDQSYFLAALDESNLDHLILPLADIRKQEVEKINERFNLGAKNRRDSRKLCFVERGDFSFYIDSIVPENLKVSGGLVHRHHKTQMGEHTGIHKFQPGQKITDSRGVNVFQLSLDDRLVVNEITSNGKVWVLPEEENFSKDCFLTFVHLRAGLDHSKPLNVHFQNSVSGKRVRGMVFFKGNDTAVCTFESPFFNLGRGQLLAFYSKEGVGARLLGHGKISSMQDFSLINRIEHLEGKLVGLDDQALNDIVKAKELKKNTIVNF